MGRGRPQNQECNLLIPWNGSNPNLSPTKPLHNNRLCSTNGLVYELGLTFTRPRNLTFDRFQLITVQKNANENLETFYSRLRELVLKHALGNVEEELIKDFFIAKINNSSIQMELLSEVRTAAQVLTFALSRERGQENHREILRSTATSWNTQVGAVTNNCPRQQPTRQHQTNTNEELCWRCGGIIYQGHITQCTAKQAICSICKKTGHFAKMCRSKNPPPPPPYPNEEPNPGADINVPRDRHKISYAYDKFKKV